MELPKQTLLWHAMQKFADVPFAYAQADCCTFANDVLKEVTGRDFMASFSYENKADMLRIFKEHGDLLGAVTHSVGQGTKAKPELLEDGDIVLARNPEDGEWIVGFFLVGCMVVKTKTGIIDWPAEMVDWFWRPA